MRPIAKVTTRFPKLTLTLFGVLVTAAAVFGSTVIPHLSSTGYSDPDSESAKVAELLVSDFNQETPHLAVAIGKREVIGAAATAEVATAANSVLSRIAADSDVSRVVSYWNSGNPPTLASKNGGMGIAYVYLDTTALDKQNQISKRLMDLTPSKIGDVHIYVGGGGAIYNGINGQITDDLKFAEMLSIPLTLLALLLIFGTAMAAAQPLLVGLSAIGASLAGIWVVNQFTDVSVFSLNLLTGLGLGLGIDYALLIVNRFREELARGRSVNEAVEITVHTAGLTVAFSGITVALTMGSMVLFPQSFLKSFAYAGVLVCLFAVLGALVPLPAALRLLGHRIDKFRIRPGRLAPADDGLWSRVARFVMRRPLLTSGVSIAALLALASLSLQLVMGQVDERVLPPDHPAAVASKLIADDFGGNAQTPIDVLVPDSMSSNQVENLAKRVSDIPGVLRVHLAEGIYQGGSFTAMPAGWNNTQMGSGDLVRIQAFSEFEPRIPESERIIKSIRGLDSRIQVGGLAADYTDTQTGVARTLPKALLWIGLTTLLLLFLFTGSVVLPIKAVLLNLLSLSATVGVITWIFQFGNLQWLTGDYTVTGALDTSTLAMIVTVTFGLSMDYEVFLLSRIKEEHDAGAGTVDSVALGLQRSGRIITAAAVLLALVFAMFTTSGVTSIKMVGIGVPFAILLDATVVRGLLVPALMRIMGDWNWWSPRWMRGVYQQYGLHD